jgi:hypothetical protein
MLGELMQGNPSNKLPIGTVISTVASVDSSGDLKTNLGG